MELILSGIFFEFDKTIHSFIYPKFCSALIFKQISLCSTKIISLLKHLKQYLQKHFLFLFFVLLNVNLLKSLM